MMSITIIAINPAFEDLAINLTNLLFVVIIYLFVLSTSIFN